MDRPRRRQRFAYDDVARGLAGLEVVEQLEDPRAALDRIVEADRELRDPAQAQSPPELRPHERHRALQALDGGLAGLRLTDDAHPDLGMPEVRAGLDVGDRHEAHGGIGDLTRDEVADLLLEQLVDAVGALGHDWVPRRRSDGPGIVAA